MILKRLSLLITIIFCLLILNSPHNGTALQYPDNDLPPIEQGIRDAQWSPDNTRLAIANPNGLIVIRETNQETLITIDAHELVAKSISWNSNGTQLASVGGATDSYIRIWSTLDGQLIREIYAFSEGVDNISWQPNGSIIVASGFSDIRAWDASTGLPVTNNVDGVSILDLQWSPDGMQFAYAATPDSIGIIHIYNGAFEGDDSLQFAGHSSFPSSVNWNFEGTQLVSAGGQDGSVRLWNVQTGTQLRLLLQIDEFVNDAIFISDDQVAASTDGGQIFIINTTSGVIEETINRDGRVWALAWNSVENLLAVGGLANGIPSPNESEINSLSIGVQSGLFDVISIEGD